MPPKASVVWFRQDLRLADNAALRAAVGRGGAVIPVYIWSQEEEGAWPAGAASRWWLHHSLAALDTDLRRRGSRLVLRRGPVASALKEVAVECGADAVLCNRRYEPAAVAQEAGLAVQAFNSALLFEPVELEKPYRVFTAFWDACLRQVAPAVPDPAPARLVAPKRWPESLTLASLELEPKIDWTAGLQAAWKPGEAGAAAQLERFLERGLADYGEDRDRPDHEGTSHLSPHLHFGEISPRAVWHAVWRMKTPRKNVYLRQLGWREFGYHLLRHNPQTPEAPLRPEFARFPWRQDRRALEAWQRGETGYPIVDAGMRELWATGWMHNRVRMIVASFLVKDLLLPWQLGARWFWDTLVDADLANNTLGWQWTAGCGADAAPFFRVFNPSRQAEKFDPEGDYVRRWASEARKPIVDHAEARRRALAAFQDMRHV